MTTLLKFNNKSFRHRIREESGHYIDQRHFLGIDPFDKTKFRELGNLHPKQTKVRKS